MRLERVRQNEKRRVRERIKGARGAEVVCLSGDSFMF